VPEEVTGGFHRKDRSSYMRTEIQSTIMIFHAIVAKFWVQRALGFQKLMPLGISPLNLIACKSLEIGGSRKRIRHRPGLDPDEERMVAGS
jgi:hypothetical protein